ncbi:MAG: type I-MYXAN CRISPR-associated protein Cas5/Cmx5/DevS [Thermoguttaceae bacterium]|nr:type I-MYXAN CRISPR-associated protein Cas5/Cmx5/DevS [Thermoguttaceae bacterium]
MIGIKVSVPIACFRKGMAREYLETDEIPPPATCYGFLLSLVGETERQRHCGSRVTPVLLKPAEQNVVLRTVWRVKKKPLGSSGNIRPDFQQLLIDVQLIIWLDSSGENTQNNDASADSTLEERVKIALDPQRRGEINRFGGLSLGESTHLVNEVSLFYDGHKIVDTSTIADENLAPVFLCQDPKGSRTWPVWVDHVGAEGTQYVTGDLVSGGLEPPRLETMPVIHW